jgi:hypothetical protein
MQHGRFKPANLRWALVALLLLLLPAWSLLQGQVRPIKTQRRAPDRFALAVETTAQQGRPAKLPPHISTLLGLAQEKECPVRQGVERDGTTVRGIDVSTANANDVVLFVVDERANDQTLYLTSPQGKLRRRVTVRAGEGTVAPITEADRQAFAQEKQFWVDRLAPDGVGK